MHKRLPEYLSVFEDLCWILLRTVQGGCLGVILLVLGWAAIGIADLAIDHGTLRPQVLIAAAQESRHDVTEAVARIGTIGKSAMIGFAVAFLMEQALVIKAYLRVIVSRTP